MGVTYSLIDDDSGFVLDTGRHTCWAGYDSALSSLFNKSPSKLKRGHHPTWSTYIPLKYDDPIPSQERNFYDEVFTKLFGHWLDPSWVTYEKIKGKKAWAGITYTSECPFWVMIASASVYRMWEESVSFYPTWRKVDELQEHMGYKMNPWTQYFLCVNIKMTKAAKTDLTETEIDISSQAGHMCIDGNSAPNRFRVQHVAALTAERFIHGSTINDILPSMYVSFYRKSCPIKIRVTGRDAFFCGNYSPDHKAVSSKDNWIAVEARKVGILTLASHNKENKYSIGNHPYIFLPHFMEKVIISNNM